MALLARLQHHGAATPLLDVTLDPFVAVHMACWNADGTPTTTSGAVFAIPHVISVDAIHRNDQIPGPGQIDPYDDRPFLDVYEDALALHDATAPDVGAPVLLCSAPPVSERLSIQRGHFLLGTVAERLTSSSTLRGLTVDSRWIPQFQRSLGRPGGPKKTARPGSAAQLAGVKIPSGKTRQYLETWIRPRSGLSPDMVYPPAWHEPHFESWASRNGRNTLVLPQPLASLASDD